MRGDLLPRLVLQSDLTAGARPPFLFCLDLDLGAR